VEELALVPEFKFVTGKFPVTPPALLEAKLIVGKSAPTIALGLTAPEEPLGEAINKFALSEVPVTANVPEDVMGVPDTVSHDGTVIATELTPPPPPVWATQEVLVPFV
jgi:hypothetical protein